MAANAPWSFRRRVMKIGERWIGDIPFVATLADGRELHMLACVRSDRHHAAARHARRILAHTSGKMPEPNVWLEVRLDEGYPYPDEIASCHARAHAQSRHWVNLLNELGRSRQRKSHVATEERADQGGLIAALARDACPKVGHTLTFSVYSPSYAGLRPKEHIYYGEPPRITIKSRVTKLELLPLPH